MVSPDSVVAATGISKSKKTILNKTRQKEVFLFSGSKHVLDFLRKEGEGSVDSFLNDENKLKSALALKLNYLEDKETESFEEYFLPGDSCLTHFRRKVEVVEITE